MHILELYGSGKVGVDAGASASTVVHELANQFSKMGHQVTVADVKSSEPRTALKADVEVVEVDVTSPIFKKRTSGGAIEWLSRRILPPEYAHMLSLLLGHHRFMRSVVSKLSFDDFEIIHTHHGLQAIFLKSRYRKSYIYTNHWCYSPRDISLDARIERKVINGAIAAVGPGSYLKSFAPEGNISIIPHGIDIEKWIPLDQATCRRNIGDADDDFIIVFVGLVAAVKGVHYLIDAIRELRGCCGRLKAYVIGSTGSINHDVAITTYARNLMEQSKNLPIRFCGFINNMSERFRQYLSAADVFVLPSENEAQGLVVLEALSMGKPVIVSNVGGLGEMVAKEVGYVFEKGDVQELTTIIRYLYDNSHELDWLKRNCRRYIEKNYTWKVIASRYIDLFEKCVSIKKCDACFCR